MNNFKHIKLPDKEAEREETLKMASGFSGPIPNYGESFEYVGMVMRECDKFILLHAGNNVVDAATKVVR